MTGAIRPRRIVAMHVPPADAAHVAADVAKAALAATLADSPGAWVTLRP